jgi:membrane protein implicated in regulation of membrane protease activity
MKPTKLSLLLLISLPTTIAAFFAASFMVGRGLQVPVSPTNLLITLAAIAAVLLALSIPIWLYRNALKQTSTQRPKRVDPFYAVRVLLLAKASSLAGVIFASWHLGVVIFQLSGAVIVQGLVLKNAFGFIASVMLVIAALITEQICRLPQDQDPDPDQAVRS